MKWKIVHNAWWMFWARGMVLGPWIWIKAKAYPQTHTLLRTYRHELQHCYQQHAYGSKWKWYLRYIWLWARKGYWKHPDEIDARLHAGNTLTEQELAWYNAGVVKIGE